MTDCPLSIVGLDGEIDGVDSAEFIMKFEEYPDVTVFVPESVNTTLASSGLFAVSALIVWKVYVVELAVCPVRRSLWVIVPVVTELTTRTLYVNELTHPLCVAVKLSYCPASTTAFDGFVIVTEQADAVFTATIRTANRSIPATL